MAEQNIWVLIITGATGILGATVAGIGSYLVQTTTAKRQRRNERASLAIAFATEIRAHMESVKIRKQEQIVASLIERLRKEHLSAKDALDDAGSLWAGDKPDEDFPVYQKLLPEMGKLGSTAQDVAGFYLRVFMVRATIKNVRGHQPSGMTLDPTWTPHFTK